MLFSSTVFIFIFLPILLLLYYIVPRKMTEARNVILLLFSLGFYAWGEPKFIAIMIISIFGNYLIGRLICESKNKKLWLVLGITFNLIIIIIFKYLNFIISNMNALFNILEMESLKLTQTNILLPIGISFFTFQAISYLIDVYREKVLAQKNLLYLGLYISFFPQLIAGPIVRYVDIHLAITERKESVEKFSIGIERFIIGISKKVIIANNVALIADKAFADVGNNEITILMAWLGAIAYTLQIYFDFSGYSDMAIGLGKMFGFDFNENFNYPYTAKSISEFWRRWHISLGTWFKDYVYIPLGGSRVKKKIKLLRNLFFVWILTGIWHGASWNFVLWGIMYFVLIAFEKMSGYPEKLQKDIYKVIYRLFAMVAIVIGWVVFRANGISDAIKYLKSLIGVGTTGLWDYTFIEFFMEYKLFMILGIVLSTPIIEFINERFNFQDSLAKEVAKTAIYMMLFIVSVSYLVVESYNPFIYFNF